MTNDSPTTYPAIPVLPMTPGNSLTWTDRRLIFAVQLRQIIDQRIGGADLATDEGRAAARVAWLQMGNDTAARAVKANAQGIIVWDLSLDELSELAPVTYVGDPRILHPAFAPIADQFFAIFRKAGLRTGVCIRHGEIVRDYSGQITRVSGESVWPSIAKASYAQQRWGCSLFYIDSNTLDGINTMPGSLANQWMISVPHSLPIWEQTDGSYPWHGFGYWDCRNGVPINVPGVPKLIAVCGSIDGAHHAELVALVKAGNPIICNGWFDDPEIVTAGKVYHEAGVAGY